ncbi:helicase-exonuclease AddAB subunit AddA [Bacillus niameyensis]|uniref:helicase-exonuclease AddAB subunit AddA n=1 Tax=Bacillus niameyensis TaxID=1522308 RepID=UPI0007829D29|nr:helicase-exonuclease AddAB subunit AddA [Bacillus niameyensis]
MKTAIPIKPNTVHWTDDQWKAIMAKDQDILVAAAAGSGKTAVLVERIIQKILAEKDPINVDQLLVATFTNAAAAEMRHRIGEALEKAISHDPLSSHLRRQLGLLNSAAISTLHSFCLNVVRKYYYLVDIDPGFRIADQTESDLLRDEVLDDLFEAQYGLEENERFFRLVDTFTNDRSDLALQELVLKLYDFSRSHPNPDQWLDRIIEMYDVTEGMSVEELPFIDVLKFDISLQLSAAKENISQAMELARMPGGPAPRFENFQDDLLIIENIEQAAYEGWEQLYDVMNQWKFSRAKPCKGDEYDPNLVKEADQLRKNAKSALEKLQKEFFSRKPEYFLKDMRGMKPELESLIELVKRFSRQFAIKKAEKGIVDFSDLEHLCLDILVEQQAGEQEPQPSEVAFSYRSQFTEVLVDEYQDVNMVQETIIRLISNGEEFNGNLFMVGDVKQSIYRFRLAEPNLFLDKYIRFTSEGNETGLRIDLSRNFRSRSEILDATNFLFKQIMGTGVGEIEYDESAELVKGSAYPVISDNLYPVEIAILDQSEKSEVDQEGTNEESFDRVELEQSRLEARFISRKIREIIDERKPIYDLKAKNERPIRYKDIVILVRSLSWASDIMEELKAAGIPGYADLSNGYFQTTEVSIMMSLLKIIDNPDQDIPLAGVLRSPIVGLDEEELAYIRLQSKRGSYYEAVKKFVSTSADNRYIHAWELTSEFIEQLGKWRGLAREGALSQLIWQLYRDTGFYEFSGGLPGGKQRQANLRALYDRARQYEETTFRGLFRFLRFIERMRERGNDLGVAHALGEEEDVVRIMTIHSSKGLEFPVVFVGGIGRKFNMRDINSSYLFDKEFGFASKYVDSEKRISYTSLPQIALRKKKKMELLAEEMRVLYVAMTRAKEKLYLVGSAKNADKEVKKWLKAAHHSDWLLRDHDRSSAVSYLDWLGMALMRHEEGSDFFPEKGEGHYLEHPSLWKMDIFSREDFSEEPTREDNMEDEWLNTIKAEKPFLMTSARNTEVISRLQWKYSHSQATSKMSKQSVTELKRIFEVNDETSDTRFIKRDPKAVYDRPKFMKEKGHLSPTEYGTAMHTVMQHIPLEDVPTLLSVQTCLAKLVEKEILTAEQAEIVSCEQIVRFFETEIGQKMLSARSIQREVPFTIGVPAKEVYIDWDGENENVLVQGIIDCILEDETGVYLIDYKTDTIHGKFAGGFPKAKNTLANRYRTQLNFYERAIQEILGKKVIGKYLYFFDGGHFLEM